MQASAKVLENPGAASNASFLTILYRRMKELGKGRYRGRKKGMNSCLVLVPWGIIRLSLRQLGSCFS